MNRMKLIIESNVENVAIVRVAISTFIAKYDVNISELVDIKTAVSEAVTNSIVHGYKGGKGEVEVEAIYKNKILIVNIKDKGCGIDDINLALTPSYTTEPELEHAGMGFTIMSAFMDDLKVSSKKNEGTIITMTKKI